MPLVRMVTSVACDDLPGVVGGEVTLPPERAQQVIAAGWAVPVREQRAERPERPEPGMETAAQTVAHEPEPTAEMTSTRRTRRRNH